MEYDTNTIVQYGCQKFRYDLYKATPSFNCYKACFADFQLFTTFLIEWFGSKIPKFVTIQMYNMPPD